MNQARSDLPFTRLAISVSLAFLYVLTSLRLLPAAVDSCWQSASYSSNCRYPLPHTNLPFANRTAISMSSKTASKPMDMPEVSPVQSMHGCCMGASGPTAVDSTNCVLHQPCCSDVACGTALVSQSSRCQSGCGVAHPYPIQPAQQHPNSDDGLLQGADSTAVYQGHYSKGNSSSSDNLKEAAGLERRSSSNREWVAFAFLEWPSVMSTQLQHMTSAGQGLRRRQSNGGSTNGHRP